MKIRYRCNLCKADRELTVRDRKDYEKLERFMDDVSRVVGISHSMSNPDCRADKFDLLMPMTPDGKIGGSKVPDSISEVEGK